MPLGSFSMIALFLFAVFRFDCSPCNAYGVHKGAPWRRIRRNPV